MSMLPHWYPNGPESFPIYERPSPSKTYRPMIRAKRSLPANRPPPPPSPDEDPVVEEATVVQNNQKKSRNVSGPKAPSADPVDDYATQMATTIITLVKEELCKTCYLR